MKKVSKKILSLFLAVFMLIAGMAVSANASTMTGIGGNYVTWVLDENGTITFSGNGELLVCDLAMPIKPSVKNIVIEDGVTAIRGAALIYFTNARSVTIPASVKAIDLEAFGFCVSLQKITILSKDVVIDDIAKLGVVNASGTFEEIARLHSDFVITDGTINYEDYDVTPLDEYVAIENCTIYGYKNSTAQTYAELKGIAFSALDEEAPVNPEEPTKPTTPDSPSTSDSPAEMLMKFLKLVFDFLAKLFDRIGIM